MAPVFGHPAEVRTRSNQSFVHRVVAEFRFSIDLPESLVVSALQRVQWRQARRHVRLSKFGGRYGSIRSERYPLPRTLLLLQSAFHLPTPRPPVFRDPSQSRSLCLAGDEDWRSLRAFVASRGGISCDPLELVVTGQPAHANDS